MRLTIKFFSTLRELTAASELSLDLPVSTAGDVWQELENRYPKLATFRSSRAIAINHTYARSEHLLQEGDEIAFFPPVSGG
jgi:molybdopterin synthase sulfur carrier subunit